MARKTSSPAQIEVDPAAPLPSCPKVQTNVYWPAPIDQRLNELVDLAVAAGERLSKADALSALVRFAPADGEQLGELVRAYRRSTAGEAVLQPEDVILLDERRPGRRRAPSP